VTTKAINRVSPLMGSDRSVESGSVQGTLLPNPL
jgi:hypothetical protein